MELLAGHPKRIASQLGVQHNIFHALVNTMRDMGLTNSRHVSLEEQLAIFLYVSVTGLSVQHLGEHFQRSNGTISRCVVRIYWYIYLLMPTQAISDQCSFSSQARRFILDMFTYHLRAIRAHLKSETIQSFTPTSRMRWVD